MKYLLIFAALILFGCEPIEITVDIPKTKPKIVVDGVFSPADSAWTVKLSLNQHVLNKETEYDALGDNEIKSVTIKDENNKLIESLRRVKGSNKNLHYLGQTAPEINKTYRIEIQTNSYGTVTASDAAPPSVPIAFAKVDSARQENTGNGKIVHVEFSDNGNTADYYEIYIIGYNKHFDYDYINNKFTEDKSKKKYSLAHFTIDDPAYEDRIVDDTKLIVDDALFNGKKATFKLKMKSYRLILSQVILRHVSADFYKFVVSKKIQKESDGPFSEPVFIQGNVQDGFGIFAGYSVAVHQL